jgi:hypothetical protein
MSANMTTADGQTVRQDPFGNGISLTSNLEILNWLDLTAKLAAGPLKGDASLAVQVAFVTEEARLRRILRPKALTARERREMREGQE